jgi:hypothetical protein
MRAGRVGLRVLGTTLLGLGLAVAAQADAPRAPTASRGERLSLTTPPGEARVLGKSTAASALQCVNSEVLYCFEGALTALVNPGCFDVGQGGDCASSDTHFMVQYFDPVEYLGDFPGIWRVCEVAWITNDGDTVWPSAGVVRTPWDPARFPTTMELESLQVQNIASPGDTAEVVVNLQDANIEFTRDHVLYVALQFPEGGVLTAPLQGPGILADEVEPNPNCDFFTVDTGATWYAPAETDPLDWGFALVIEPVVAVEEANWSLIKRLYRDQTQTLTP